MKKPNSTCEKLPPNKKWWYMPLLYPMPVPKKSTISLVKKVSLARKFDTAHFIKPIRFHTLF